MKDRTARFSWRKGNVKIQKPNQSTNRVQANTVDKTYRTSWEGRDWLVVPTVMIREGVLNGELVPAEELAKFPAAWNGRPFVIDHPHEGDTAVSANDPAMMEKHRAGYVFGTEYRESDQSVPAELWIDVDRAGKLKGGPELMRRVLDGDKIEVSTGYFRDLEKRGGEWQGQSYNGVARNLRPDHLAALLDSVGACSWEDGCGCPRVNEAGEPCTDTMIWSQPTELVYQAEETDMGKQAVGNDAPKKNIVKGALHILASALGIDDGTDISEDVETMAKSKADLVKDLCTRLELNADDNAEGFEALSADVLRKILNAFGKPDKEDEPEEDKPEKEDEPMPQEEQTPETEAAKAADEPEEEEPTGNEQPCADAVAAQEERMATLEKLVADLSSQLEASKDVVKAHQEAQASEKARLVSELAANERCAFSKDELERQDVPTLQKLARSLMPRSYAGQEGGPTANQKQDTRPIVAWSGNRAGKEK